MSTSTSTRTSTSTAPLAISGTDESMWLQPVAPQGILKPGRNTVAVEVHQNRANSSDLGFDLSLTGFRQESAKKKPTKPEETEL